ncbi:hypothetical protein PR048_016361 [Dryococelus australis]|uniref:Uncharacterized protein n=1 Tax=Dryococelus australis TaxID=614101 RepID=A0ABQ9HJJ6_9NEOP|nr:hypothetical protein PR048_016361 [Dryococelus australis]
MRPLMMAAWHGHKDAVEMLINCGANVAAVNKICTSAICKEESKEEVAGSAEWFEKPRIQYCGGKAPLRNYVPSHQLRGTANTRGTAQCSAMPVCPQKQYTLLMCAARNNRLPVVNLLLDTLENVQVDAADCERQTALFHAALGGHLHVVARLVDAHAHIDCPNKRSVDREQPVGRKEGRKEGKVRCVQAGRTPLHAACERGNMEVAEFLLQRGAASDARDEDGNAALHVAAENQQTDVVSLLLLQAGARPDPDNAVSHCSPRSPSCSLHPPGHAEANLLPFPPGSRVAPLLHTHLASPASAIKIPNHYTPSSPSSYLLQSSLLPTLAPHPPIHRLPIKFPPSVFTILLPTSFSPSIFPC